MQTLSQEQINEIRNSVDIVDVVSKYIPLTKKGKNYFGVCPFHEDSDPSLSVSPDLTFSIKDIKAINIANILFFIVLFIYILIIISYKGIENIYFLSRI